MFASASSKTRPKPRARWPVLTLLAVAGCATLPETIPLPDLGDWDARRAVLGGLESWEFRGRIAVKAGDDGFNGRLDWAQDGEAYAATVGGPLGIGTVRIEGDARRAVHTDKDGIETVLEDVENELYFRYGWTIPVASLRFWALGIPDPSAPAETEFDAAGMLSRLEQKGWTVRIARYAEGGGQPMPRILSAENARTRVRIVIDRWLFLDR